MRAGERRWAKLCFELSPQGHPTVVTVVTRELSDDCNSFEVDGDAVWLRITRKGRAWAFHAAADDGAWRLVRYFSLGDPQADGPVKVGVLAQSPAGEGLTATFDHIGFGTDVPADLRDGT